MDTQYNLLMKHIGLETESLGQVEFKFCLDKLKSNTHKWKAPLPKLNLDGNKVFFDFEKRDKLSVYKKKNKKYPFLVVGLNSTNEEDHPGHCYRFLYECFGIPCFFDQPPTLHELMSDFLPKFHYAGFTTDITVPDFFVDLDNEIIHFHSASTINSQRTINDLLDILFTEYRKLPRMIIMGKLNFEMFQNYSDYKKSDLLSLFALYPSYWNCRSLSFTDKPERILYKAPVPAKERVYWYRKVESFYLEHNKEMHAHFKQMLQDQGVTFEKLSKWSYRPEMRKKLHSIERINEEIKNAKEKDAKEKDFPASESHIKHPGTLLEVLPNDETATKKDSLPKKKRPATLCLDSNFLSKKLEEVVTKEVFIPFTEPVEMLKNLSLIDNLHTRSKAQQVISQPDIQQQVECFREDFMIPDLKIVSLQEFSRKRSTSSAEPKIQLLELPPVQEEKRVNWDSELERVRFITTGLESPENSLENESGILSFPSFKQKDNSDYDYGTYDVDDDIGIPNDNPNIDYNLDLYEVSPFHPIPSNIESTELPFDPAQIYNKAEITGEIYTSVYDFQSHEFNSSVVLKEIPVDATELELKQSAAVEKTLNQLNNPRKQTDLPVFEPKQRSKGLKRGFFNKNKSPVYETTTTTSKTVSTSLTSTSKESPGSGIPESSDAGAADREFFSMFLEETIQDNELPILDDNYELENTTVVYSEKDIWEPDTREVSESQMGKYANMPATLTAEKVWEHTHRGGKWYLNPEDDTDSVPTRTTKSSSLPDTNKQDKRRKSKDLKVFEKTSVESFETCKTQQSQREIVKPRNFKEVRDAWNEKKKMQRVNQRINHYLEIEECNIMAVDYGEKKVDLRIRKSLHRLIQSRIQLPFTPFKNSCYAEALHKCLIPFRINCDDVFKTGNQYSLIDYWNRLNVLSPNPHFGILHIIFEQCQRCFGVVSKGSYEWARDLQEGKAESIERHCEACDGRLEENGKLPGGVPGKLKDHLRYHYYIYSEFAMFYNTDIHKTLEKGEEVKFPITNIGQPFAGIDYETTEKGWFGHYSCGRGNFCVFSRMAGKLPSPFIRCFDSKKNFRMIGQELDYPLPKTLAEAGLIGRSRNVLTKFHIDVL